jgi:hypothetical protein
LFRGFGSGQDWGRVLAGTGPGPSVGPAQGVLRVRAGPGGLAWSLLDRLCLFKVKSCIKRGLRSPELAGKVDWLIGQLLFLTECCDQRWDFYSGAICGIRELVVSIRERFSFLHELPYTLIRGRDRAVAGAAIVSYDESAARSGHKKRQHRIAHRLLKEGGEFRAHLEVILGGSFLAGCPF